MRIPAGWRKRRVHASTDGRSGRVHHQDAIGWVPPGIGCRWGNILVSAIGHDPGFYLALPRRWAVLLYGARGAGITEHDEASPTHGGWASPHGEGGGPDSGRAPATGCDGVHRQLHCGTGLLSPCCTGMGGPRAPPRRCPNPAYGCPKQHRRGATNRQAVATDRWRTRFVLFTDAAHRARV